MLDCLCWSLGDPFAVAGKHSEWDRSAALLHSASVDEAVVSAAISTGRRVL